MMFSLFAEVNLTYELNTCILITGSGIQRTISCEDFSNLNMAVQKSQQNNSRKPDVAQHKKGKRLALNKAKWKENSQFQVIIIITKEA